MKLRISERSITLRLSPQEFLDLKQKKMLQQKISFSSTNCLEWSLGLLNESERNQDSLNYNNGLFKFNLSLNSYKNIESLIEKREEGTINWMENIFENKLKVIVDVDRG